MMPTHDAFTFDVYDDTYDALPILRDELCQSKTTTSNNEQRSAEGQYQCEGTGSCKCILVVFVGFCFARVLLLRGVRAADVCRGAAV